MQHYTLGPVKRTDLIKGILNMKSKYPAPAAEGGKASCLNALLKLEYCIIIKR